MLILRQSAYTQYVRVLARRDEIIPCSLIRMSNPWSPPPSLISPRRKDSSLSPASSQRVSLFCIRVNSFVIMIFIDESCTEVLRVGAEVIRRSVFSSARKCGIPPPSPHSTLFHSLARFCSLSLARSLRRPPSHALSVVFAYSLHGLLEYCAELRLHGIYGIRWHSGWRTSLVIVGHTRFIIARQARHSLL